MRRRDFILGIAGAIVVVPRHVAAQTTTKIYHLASLTASSAFLTNSPNIAMLLAALAEHGYKLGQNLQHTPYGADERYALFSCGFIISRNEATY